MINKHIKHSETILKKLLHYDSRHHHRLLLAQDDPKII